MRAPTQLHRPCREKKQFERQQPSHALKRMASSQVLSANSTKFKERRRKTRNLQPLARRGPGRSGTTKDKKMTRDANVMRSDD